MGLTRGRNAIGHDNVSASAKLAPGKSCHHLSLTLQSFIAYNTMGSRVLLEGLDTAMGSVSPTGSPVDSILQELHDDGVSNDDGAESDENGTSGASSAASSSPVGHSRSVVRSIHSSPDEQCEPVDNNRSLHDGVVSEDELEGAEVSSSAASSYNTMGSEVRRQLDIALGRASESPIQESDESSIHQARVSFPPIVATDSIIDHKPRARTSIPSPPTVTTNSIVDHGRDEPTQSPKRKSESLNLKTNGTMTGMMTGRCLRISKFQSLVALTL
jgi:hypothetical protein